MSTLDTEIRKLQADQLSGIAKILNHDDCWKQVMAIVPKFDSPNEPLFKTEHINMIEQTVKMQQRTGAEIFLTEWSTMGRRRPTCSTLLNLLVKTKLFRAADYLAVEVLKIDRPERPKTGPAAPIDLSDALVEALLKQQVIAAKNTESNDAERAWSMHLQGQPSGLAANAESADKSDLIKFESKVSDLMQFSKTTDKIIEQLPEDMSNLIKFSSDNSSSNVQMEDFTLPEARSEDIPLCVKEDMFQFDSTVSSAIENSATGTSISSSSISRTEDTKEEIDLPQVSERFIPVVVFECSDDKNES